MRKTAWFFKNKTLLGILSAMLVFGTLATGCPTTDSDPEPTTFTVTFNVDGGSAVENQTVQEGKTVTKPANPTKAGNTFAGWYRDSAKTILWKFDTDVVVADTTIYAKWVQGTVSSYKVTFNVDGGSPAPAEQTIVSGEKVAEPAKPSKAGFIFDGWYNGETEWDFRYDPVTAAITLKAKWAEAVTVTFNTNGGSTIASVTVAKGEEVYLGSYTPKKPDNVFDGWYTDDKLTTLAESELTVAKSITLYAKWTSTSALAGYAGVWRDDDDDDGQAYWLQADGTAWRFYPSDFSKTTWSTSQIAGYAVTFNEGKTEFTMYNTTYTKNTTTKKTPAAATGSLLGTWISGGSYSMELKSDKTAVLSRYNETINLGYCVESNTLYLLAPSTNLVIISIGITDGKPGYFSKTKSDTTLAGIWKLTANNQDYYWNLKADGSGTFHTLGASIPVSFTVTDNGEIDGESYTISGDKLTLDKDIVLTKVASVPSGSGADGDSRLHGTWKMTQGGETYTMTFKSNGALEQSWGDSFIWKADGANCYLYSSSFGSTGSSPMPYTISGSTLTAGGLEFTKQ